jgi:hypothetical protein
MPETSIAWGDLQVFQFSDGVNIYGREFQILPSGTMFGVREMMAGVIGFTASRSAPEQWSVATGDPLMCYGIRGTDPATLLPYYRELVDAFKAKQNGRQQAPGG